MRFLVVRTEFQKSIFFKRRMTPFIRYCIFSIRWNEKKLILASIHHNVIIWLKMSFLLWLILPFLIYICIFCPALNKNIPDISRKISFAYQGWSFVSSVIYTVSQAVRCSLQPCPVFCWLCTSIWNILVRIEQWQNLTAPHSWNQVLLQPNLVQHLKFLNVKE